MLPIGLKFLKFAKEVDLASLISDIDGLDIDKLKTVSFDLYELSNVAENDNIKKAVYDELVKKFNAIQTIDAIDQVKQADYKTKID